MRLDMKDAAHYQLFINLCQFAGQESDMLKKRLGGAKRVKAEMGLYAGGNITSGYIVDRDKRSDTFERFLAYEPHAAVVQELFKIGFEISPSITKMLQEVKIRGLYFPFFEPQFSIWMNSRSALRLCKKFHVVEGKPIGWRITKSMLYSIFTNPAYMGEPIRHGKKLVGVNFPAIISRKLFISVYDKFINEKSEKDNRYRRNVDKNKKHPLKGLTFWESD